MRQKEFFVIANFKMNLTTKHEVEHWLLSFEKASKDLPEDGRVKTVLCPQAIYLEKFKNKFKSDAIDFGIQNCFWQDKGAFTGEISPAAAHSLGANYVILGHSERRNYLGETDEMVAYKIKAALKNRIRPVLCIGEDADQKRKDQLKETLLEQLKMCLSFVSSGMLDQVVICYEPVWAISANNPDHLPTSNEIMGAKLLIRKFLLSQYDEVVANRVKIIYGGSVDSKNVEEVCISAGMDGALVGSASLMPYELVKIGQALEK